MKEIFVHGLGCVSPAGWGVPALREALARGAAAPAVEMTRPGATRRLVCRSVPPPPAKQPFLSHPRLRRSGPLTVYAAAAACEALNGQERGGRRLGVIFCVTGGCVQFSRRFYDEAWRNPATASPLVFPETVFNAPASHLGALLESTAINYTYVGDPSVVLQGLATAAEWIQEGRVDHCVVVGAEESDWLTADAWRHFSRATICSEGAGAMLLSAQPGAVRLERVTSPRLYLAGPGRAHALAQTRADCPSGHSGEILCDSRTGVPSRDRAEAEAWQDWPGLRMSPKKCLGEGLAAGAAWQCVAALDALRRGEAAAAVISVAGTHEHAVAARFVRANA